MRFLRSNTATRITVGPFYDKTDGVTPETAITVTSCKLTLMVDDAGVPTLVLDTAPTASGGANDMVHVTNDDSGYYDLELAAANVNYVGRASLAISDAAVHCPVFHEFMILPAHVYDALTVATGAAPIFGVVDQGTLQSATATTAVIRSAAAFGDDILNGATLIITGGTGAGQRRIITDFAGATDTATVDTWTTTPDNTSTYVIFGSAPASTSVPTPANVTQWLGTAAATPSVAGVPEVDLTHIGGTAGTFAAGIPEVKVNNIAANAITAASIAADAITAAKIATDAIGSDELATSAVSKILTTAMTEAYAADGATNTVAQAFYWIIAALTEFSVSGTTVTLKKLDGSTTAGTLTMSDASDPTSLTRAT